MIVTIDIPFKFFQIVYLRSDPTQSPRQVIGVKYCADNGILVELASGETFSWHYLGEVSDTKIYH